MMRRRQFITVLGGAATWPMAARAQQPAMPVIGFLDSRSSDGMTRRLAGFRQGLKEVGFAEGENVSIVYRWAENRIDRLPELAADLARRQVAVIAAPSTPAALAAKAATTTTPIVFGVGDDPVKLGLIASLAKPGGNATGINFLGTEVTAKRLALLRELVAKANRIAVLVNPADSSVTETTLKEVREAAPALGLQIVVFNAGSVSEIDAAFAERARERADALLVAGGGFFFVRRGQFATLAARDRVPTSFASREYVEAGGLMSYGTNVDDAVRQMGVYAGRILKGTKPVDLPVFQSTKFELLVNLQTAKAIGLEVPPILLARADEVIE